MLHGPASLKVMRALVEIVFLKTNKGKYNDSSRRNLVLQGPAILSVMRALGEMAIFQCSESAAFNLLFFNFLLPDQQRSGAVVSVLGS